MRAHLRVARATDQLEAIAEMYRCGLGFEVLGSFRDHDGFDGVMLGHAGSAYHLEFTRQAGAEPEPAPGPESLLIFYLPVLAEWEAACERMLASGFQTVAAHNPYWDRHGRTFEDLDGHRVVLQHARWPAKEDPG